MNVLPRYEILMLVPTETTNDDIATIERHIEDFSAKAEGAVISFDRWGKYQLCYPVKKQSYGVYLLSRFELPHDKASSALKDLDTLFKIRLNDLVLRHVVAKLDDQASLEYHKPESLDVTRAAGSELKEEAKIEQLLDTVEASKPRAAAERDAAESEDDKSEE